MLDRDAAMRPLVAHGADDAGLRIAPLDRLDAGGAAQRRVLARRRAATSRRADALPSASVPSAPRRFALDALTASGAR